MKNDDKSQWNTMHTHQVAKKPLTMVCVRYNISSNSYPSTMGVWILFVAIVSWLIALLSFYKILGKRKQISSYVFLSLKLRSYKIY